MTAKEKAIKLGNKFYQGSVFDYTNEEHVIEKERARDNAIVCVQEILDHAGTVNTYDVSFWYDVMKELELL